MHCLFCNSSEIKKASFPRPTFFNDKKFEYYQCKKCKLIFVNPLPSSDDYLKMYAKTYHEQFYFKNASPDYKDLYRLLKENLSERSILDYGCGDGYFLQYFLQKGYKCAGVEYDPELVSLLKTKFPAINFYTVREFNRLDKAITFDNIHLGDVFEHLTNPNELISILRLKLNRNGFIIVEGPVENNFTLALAFRKFVSLFKAGNQAYHVPYHITFSNAKNQRQIFEKNDFVTLYYKVYETTWPMPEVFSFKPATGFKWVVAKISILVSNIFPGKLGNRFVYLGRKNNE